MKIFFVKHGKKLLSQIFNISEKDALLIMKNIRNAFRYGVISSLKSALRSHYGEKYGIKKFYICNFEKKPALINIPKADNFFQYKAYEFARDIIEKNGLGHVLDIGCGLGSKLDEVIRPVCGDISGIDTQHAINICKERYSFGRWLADDIENPKLDLSKEFDLILSLDVIEHLVDPDKLLTYIKKNSGRDTFIIVSTPERDLVRGKYDFGPPDNRYHVREWNTREFSDYIASRGFEVLNHFLVQSGLGSTSKTCQVMLCKIDIGRKKQ